MKRFKLTYYKYSLIPILVLKLAVFLLAVYVIIWQILLPNLGWSQTLSVVSVVFRDLFSNFYFYLIIFLFLFLYLPSILIDLLILSYRVTILDDGTITESGFLIPKRRININDISETRWTYLPIITGLITLVLYLFRRKVSLAILKTPEWAGLQYGMFMGPALLNPLFNPFPRWPVTSDFVDEIYKLRPDLQQSSGPQNQSSSNLDNVQRKATGQTGQTVFVLRILFFGFAFLAFVIGLGEGGLNIFYILATVLIILGIFAGRPKKQ